MDARRNDETQGNTRLHIVDGHGMNENRAAFVKNKNPFCYHTGLSEDRLKLAVKYFQHVEKAGEIPKHENIGTIVCFDLGSCLH